MSSPEQPSSVTRDWMEDVYQSFDTLLLARGDVASDVVLLKHFR